MQKIKVNNAYIDRVVEYLNELQSIAGKGVSPEGCGMCDATDELEKVAGLEDDCDACPLDESRTGDYCDDREMHLRSRLFMSKGLPCEVYRHATKASTLRRVKWIAKMVNEHTENDEGWEVVP